MIRNYLKIAFRNLWGHKAFTFINTAGLSIGMTACLLIFLYVHFELSYDSFNQKGGRIYRLVTDVKTPTETIHADITSAPMATNIKLDFPQVQKVTRILFNGLLVQNGSRKFQEDNLMFADSSLFSIFTLPFVEGNPAKALTAPFEIVLSQTDARKYFGNSDPLGQTVTLEGTNVATITGVMKDMPENSQFHTDIILSMSTLLDTLNPGMGEQWSNFGFYTYLLLAPDADPKQLQAKFPSFLKKHIDNSGGQGKMSYDLFLEPLKSVYLHSKRGSPESGNLADIYIFSIIGIFILVIACINFVNLTTARSSERAREVGVRKVVGAARNQLTLQFLGESVLISLFSLIIAVILSSLLLPLFNQLAGKAVLDNLFHHGSYLFLMFLFALAVGLMAGIYPAVFLSGFRPVSVLKGNFFSGLKGIALRKSLVVAQFTISIVLIAGTLIISRQLQFMRSQPLGFRKDQMLVIDFHGDQQVQAKFNRIKSELWNIPGVLSVSGSASLPGLSVNQAAFTELQLPNGTMQSSNMNLYSTDFDFIKQYQLQMIAGRGFSLNFPADSTHSLIINEAAVKSLGYLHPQDIVGKKFTQWGREGQIIGVVKDFNYRSLKDEVQPLAMRIAPDNGRFYSLNISSSGVPATIKKIQDKWTQLAAQRPFDYFFVDEAFNKQYRSDERFGQLFLYFAILAIFISCMGLLGLAAYSTLQRTKEIGVRKVLGASVSGVAALLSRDFIKLVLIAIVVAVPVAWWVMSKWLQGFAYRMPISWVTFLIASLLAIFVALATVSVQAVRAAMTNPVNSLHME